jgi:hypothetical protein
MEIDRCHMYTYLYTCIHNTRARAHTLIYIHTCPVTYVNMGPVNAELLRVNSETDTTDTIGKPLHCRTSVHVL